MDDDYENQLETLQQLINFTKNKIDITSQDKYSYTQANNILSHVQNLVNATKQNTKQFMTFNTFQIQMQSLFQTFKQWTDDVQELMCTDKNPFNDLQLQVINACIFHTQFSLQTVKFLLKTQLPAKSIQSENMNTVLNIFYQCMYGRCYQISFTYCDLISNFTSFFKKQIEKYKDVFDEHFMITDDQTIIQDVFLRFGDMWMLQDLLNKLLENIDLSQFTKGNLSYTYNIGCPFESLESSRLRGVFQSCNTFDEVLQFFKKQRTPPKQDLKQFPQFQKTDLEKQNEQTHKYGRLLVNLLENAKCFQKQLPICITANELIELPKPQIEIFCQQLNAVTNTSKNLCDQNDLSFQMLTHYKSETQSQRLRKDRDTEKNIEKILQTSANQVKDLSSKIETIATAAPHIITRFIAREAIRYEQKSIMQMDKKSQQKIANQIMVFYYDQIDKLYVELALNNKEYDVQLKQRDDVQRELLRASEIEDKAVFAYGEHTEAGVFICNATRAFLQLAINYLFLAFDQREIAVAALSGQISPHKSAFSTKNCIAYLQDMENYWAQCQPLALIFYRAQQLVGAICTIKQGSTSEQVSLVQRSRYFSHKPGLNRFFMASLIHLVKADSEASYLYQKYVKICKKISQHFQNQESVKFIAQHLENVKNFYENDLLTVINQALGYAEIYSNRSQITSFFGPGATISNNLMKVIYANSVKTQIQRDFEIVVCGYKKSGKSSIINHLVYQPLLRFSTVEELLKLQESRFHPEKIIGEPGPQRKPWWLPKNTHIRHKKLSGSKSRIINDEIMSTGSWLHLDTTVCEEISLIQDIKQQPIDIKGFMKDIHIVAKTQEESGMGKEKLAEKIDKTINKGKNSIESIKPNPKLKLQPLEKITLENGDNEINDDISINSVESQGPGTPGGQSGQIKPLSGTYKSCQYPPLSFQPLKPINNAQDVVKQSIPLINFQPINFYDIPHFALFSARSSDVQQQQQEMSERLIQKLEQGKNNIQQEFSQLQKTLITELKAMMGQAGQLNTQYRQAQQQILAQLVDKQTNKLNMEQVQKLNQIIASQLDAEHQNIQQVIKEFQDLQKQIEQYMGHCASDQNRIKQLQDSFLAAQKQSQMKQAEIANTIKQLLDEQSCLDRASECYTQQEQYQAQTKEIQYNIQQLKDRRERTTTEMGQKIMAYVNSLKAHMYLFVYSAVDPEPLLKDELKSIFQNFIQQETYLIVICNKSSLGHFVNVNNVEMILSIIQELQQSQQKQNKIIHIFTDSIEGIFINDLLRFYITKAILESLGINNYEELKQNTYQL